MTLFTPSLQVLMKLSVKENHTHCTVKKQWYWPALLIHIIAAIQLAE